MEALPPDQAAPLWQAVHAQAAELLVINLKTAKALSLTVPPTLLTAADDVIE